MRELIEALKANEAWRKDAACKGMDPALWFPPQGGWVPKIAYDTCFGCAVRQDCLDYALKNNETHGIWGGYSERQRKRMRRSITRKARTTSPFASWG